MSDFVGNSAVVATALMAAGFAITAAAVLLGPVTAVAVATMCIGAAATYAYKHTGTSDGPLPLVQHNDHGFDQAFSFVTGGAMTHTDAHTNAQTHQVANGQTPTDGMSCS